MGNFMESVLEFIEAAKPNDFNFNANASLVSTKIADEVNLNFNPNLKLADEINLNFMKANTINVTMIQSPLEGEATAIVTSYDTPDIKPSSITSSQQAPQPKRKSASALLSWPGNDGSGAMDIQPMPFSSGVHLVIDQLSFWDIPQGKGTPKSIPFQNTLFVPILSGSPQYIKSISSKSAIDIKVDHNRISIKKRFDYDFKHMEFIESQNGTFLGKESGQETEEVEIGDELQVRVSAKKLIDNFLCLKLMTEVAISMDREIVKEAYLLTYSCVKYSHQDEYFLLLVQNS